MTVSTTSQRLSSLPIQTISRPRLCLAQQTYRFAAPCASLSTTPATQYRQKAVPNSSLPIPSPTAKQPHIPPYPYGEYQSYKQRNTGLYGSSSLRFGNHVSEKYEVKTRRRWRPNVQARRLWSVALGMYVRTRITMRVLRTLDKVGGLDEYLLGGKPARVKELGPWGWKLRWRLMQTPAVQEKFSQEREKLGVGNPAAIMATSEATSLAEQGIRSAEALMQETDRMLQEGEEFGIGEEKELFEETPDIRPEVRA